MKSLLNTKATQILSVGSVDGILSAAAVLRNLADENCEIEFCQAFTVDKVNPQAWQANRKVVFVDLAVNNRDESMTVDFIKRILDAGHEIVGILDEHNAKDWQRVCQTVGLDFDGLEIKPVSQDEGKIKSSGALFHSLFWDEVDEHTRQLCQAADAGDRMDFSTHFGRIVNEAVKSRIADDSRRVYMAKHFAKNAEADSTIQGWMAEYQEILANHEEILAAAEDLGDGILRVNAVGKTVDMTTLMGRLYRQCKVAIVVGESYNKALGKKTTQHGFGIPRGAGDLLTVIKDVVPTASGFAEKVNVDPEYGKAAVEAARRWLTAT